MPRSIPDESRELAKRLLRAGGTTTREVARLAGIGVGTVTRMRSEMGLSSTDGRGNNGRKKIAAEVIPNRLGGRPTNFSKLGTNYDPSPAARRLAQFDKVVARALALKEPEDD